MEQDKKQKEIIWPVKYDQHPIYEAWEVWTKGYRDNIYGIKVESAPLGQLIITRDKNFYDLDETGRGFYFNEGYKYFWVNYKIGEWCEKTSDEFRDLKCQFENEATLGRKVYTLNLAYSMIPSRTCYKSYTYRDYSDYLRFYYPDYMEEDVCAVFVLWNKNGLPLVLIRQKCGNKWDMVYPGDKAYVSLKRFYWSDLEHFGRDLGKLEQVYPPECFGDRIGARQEKQYMRIGHTFYRTDIPARPRLVNEGGYSLTHLVTLDDRHNHKHRYDP